jgi:hypothetical protein
MQIIITEVDSTTRFWFIRKGKDYHEVNFLLMHIAQLIGAFA